MKNNSVLWCEIISFTLSTTAWLQVYQKQDVFHFYNRHILVFSFLKGGFFCKLEASKISGVNGLLKENINNLSLHLSKILYRFAVFIFKWNRNSTFSYETFNCENWVGKICSDISHNTGCEVLKITILYNSGTGSHYRTCWALWSILSKLLSLFLFFFSSFLAFSLSWALKCSVASSELGKFLGKASVNHVQISILSQRAFMRSFR